MKRNARIMSPLILSLVYLLTCFSCSVQVMAGNGQNYSRHPGSTGVEETCDTIPPNLQTIAPPWDKIELTSDRMKPGYPFRTGKASRKYWLPIGIGALVGGGTAVWLLTREGDKPESPCTLDPVSVITSSTCGRPDGSIILSLTGEPEVLYQWSNGASSAQISGLTPGAYSVTLTRADGSCRTTRSYIVPDQPIEFQVNSTVEASDCGRDNGVISISILPDEPFTYLWSTGSVTPHISALSPGIYTLAVTLGETCSSEYSFEVEEEDPELTIDYSVTGGSCTGGGDIEIALSNASGSGMINVRIEGPEGEFQFTTTPGMHKLSEWMNIRSGAYVLEAWEPEAGESCSVSIEVTVPYTGIELSAMDDRYQTEFETPLQENCLTNDSGEGLIMTEVKEEVGGEVTWTSEGAFVFNPDPGFSGLASFKYIVQDNCDSTDEAMVTIEVLPKGCEFTTQISTIDASCGFNDGVATIVVNEPGNYTYTWENGEAGQTLPNIPAGTYVVYIEDVDLGCVKEFVVIIEEDPAEYYQNLNVQQPVCSTPGEIRFEAITVASGPMNMEVFHPGGDQVFIVEPGLIFLSDYIPIVEGPYKIILYDEGIGPGCIHEFNTSMGPMEFVEIALEGVIPPTMPTAMDGSIIGVVVDPGAEPYSIFFNGQFRGNFSGPVFTIEGVGVGDHDVWIVDRNGCMSNILEVLIIFAGDPEYVRITGNLGMPGPTGAPEHPGKLGHPLQSGLLLAYQKEWVPRVISFQGGVLFGPGWLSLSGSIELKKEIRLSDRTVMHGKLIQGGLWNGERVDWYTQLGPGLRFGYPGKISWDLDFFMTYAQDSWFALPSLSMNIPVRLRNKKISGR